MYLPDWLSCVIGYAFSILVGDHFLRRFSEIAWESIGEYDPEKPEAHYKWTTSLLGIVERALYTSAILLQAGEFIAIWMAIKATSQWKRWDDLGASKSHFQYFPYWYGILDCLWGAGRVDRNVAFEWRFCFSHCLSTRDGCSKPLF